MSKQVNEYDDKGFNLSLALVDAIPVIMFCGSTCIVATIFGSIWFVAGAVLCIMAGLGKVIWKMHLALAHHNVWFLNRQLRVLMPAGFLLMLLALVIDRDMVDANAVRNAIISMPSLIFFLVGMVGMVAMFLCARKLDGRKVQANWVEQTINSVAQTAIFIGLLFLK